MFHKYGIAKVLSATQDSRVTASSDIAAIPERE